MSWGAETDLAVLRWINRDLAHPALDGVMLFLSGTWVSIPLAAAGLALLALRGGVRGRCCVLLVGITLAAGEYGLVAPLKRAIARPRPYAAAAGVRHLGPSLQSLSMPSGHAAMSAATTAIVALLYRRRPAAVAAVALTAAGVGLSRPYLGVHYPSDVLAGWILGAGYGWAIPHLADRVWGAAGRRWFPDAWTRLPSLRDPDRTAPAPGSP